MFELSQSGCGSCYDGDMQFPTFEECWKRNPVAHMFPDHSRMKKGAYKTCFIGMLGVPTEDLPKLTADIRAFDPKLTTQDIVTCIELGASHHGSLFNFTFEDEVLIVGDPLRQALINQTGVVQGGMKDRYWIQMNTVLEKDIRLVTEGSHVQVTVNTSDLHGRSGIAQHDGGLDGWCAVKIGMATYTIPTIWLTTISAEAPQSVNWNSIASVNLVLEQLVPTHHPNTSIKFVGDGILGVADIVKIFDPDSTVTPRIFTAFDTNMGSWSQQAQKDAVLDSMCELHARASSRYFEHEAITRGKLVHFNWEGCSGTQCIFDSKEEQWLYVDNSSPDVRAEAFIGWYSRALDTIEWEIPHHRTVDHLERIQQRDEDLMVINSRVTSRFDYTRKGIIWHRTVADTTCVVEWDQEVGALGEPDRTDEKLADLERSVFIKQVVMPTGLVSGTVCGFHERSPPKYVYVAFKDANTTSDGIGAAWFDLAQLDDSRLRHRLRVFMSYPWRTVRFSVQERVGVSFACIIRGQYQLFINTSRALHNFREAMSTFCIGASQMHKHHITHNDIHDGNLTIAQSADGESFSIKMIDFDRMRVQPRNGQVEPFENDLKAIVKGMDTLVHYAECSSTDPCVQSSYANTMRVLKDLLFARVMDARRFPPVFTALYSPTVDFLTRFATELKHMASDEQPRPFIPM